MEEKLTTPTHPEPVVISIASAGNKRDAAECARQFALRLGFSHSESDEIALAVTELASNVLEHAGSGQIHLKSLQTERSVALQVVCEDNGPGLRDSERAMTDGYSTAGSLGAGLGAVNRLMDTLEFFARPEGGLRIVCERWPRPKTGNFFPRRLEFGAATRSCRLMRENGDTFVIQQWEDHALAGVIDGLGHGHFAQRASQAARQYLEHHFDQPLDNLFRGVGRACRATRGVVMALARFDLSGARFDLATIGNVEVRLLGQETPFKPAIRRGVVGHSSAPAPVTTAHPWTGTNVLIIHSDGINSRWHSDQIGDLSSRSAAELARGLVERFGRIDDDATVLVARTKKT